MAAITAASAVAVGGSTAGAAQPGWTVLVYVAADNNLEPFAIPNLMQMASVGSGPGLDIEAFIDRSPSYSDQPLGNLGNWSGAKVVQVNKGSFAEEQNLGNVDSGDPGDAVELHLECREAPSVRQARPHHLGSRCGMARLRARRADEPHHQPAEAAASDAVGLEGGREGEVRDAGVRRLPHVQHRNARHARATRELDHRLGRARARARMGLLGPERSCRWKADRVPTSARRSRTHTRPTR